MAEILVIDDEAPVRSLVRRALGMRGHTVHEADDGMKGIARYAAARYRSPDQQALGALFLDACCRLITDVEIFRGTLTRAAVELAKEYSTERSSGFVNGVLDAVAHHVRS